MLLCVFVCFVELLVQFSWYCVSFFVESMCICLGLVFCMVCIKVLGIFILWKQVVELQCMLLVECECSELLWVQQGWCRLMQLCMVLCLLVVSRQMQVFWQMLFDGISVLKLDLCSRWFMWIVFGMLLLMLFSRSSLCEQVFGLLCKFLSSVLQLFGVIFFEMWIVSICFMFLCCSECILILVSVGVVQNMVRQVRMVWRWRWGMEWGDFVRW